MTTLAASVGTAPTLLFTPSATVQAVVITNTGTSTVYLGQSGVTAALGLPLSPGQSLNLTNQTVALYGVAGANTVVSPTDTLSAPASQGATALTVASGGAAFTNGMIVSIQDGNNSELVTVGNGSTGTSVVVSATAFAHATGVTFGQFSSRNGASVRVTYGAGNS